MAVQFKHSCGPEWEVQDLIQEALLEAHVKRTRFRGSSSFETYAWKVARNRFTDLARRNGRSPVSCNHEMAVLALARDTDRERAKALRENTSDLLGWLRSHPDRIRNGWEVMNLLLWQHGDAGKVASMMTVSTGVKWSRHRVWATVMAISRTKAGLALCEALQAGT